MVVRLIMLQDVQDVIIQVPETEDLIADHHVWHYVQNPRVVAVVLANVVVAVVVVYVDKVVLMLVQVLVIVALSAPVIVLAVVNRIVAVVLAVVMIIVVLNVQDVPEVALDSVVRLVILCVYLHVEEHVHRLVIQAAPQIVISNVRIPAPLVVQPIVPAHVKRHVITHVS